MRQQLQRISAGGDIDSGFAVCGGDVVCSVDDVGEEEIEGAGDDVR